MAEVTTEDFINLLNKRNLTPPLVESPATPELIQELNEFLLKKYPCAGTMRILSLGLSLEDKIQIIASPLAGKIRQFGDKEAERYLAIEAGALATLINLYLLTKGLQVRFNFNYVPDGLNIRLLLTLAILKSNV